VRFNALPSTAYRIAVDGKEGSQGAVFLNLFPGPTRPSNDDLASAQVIAQSSYASASGANLGATVETAEPDHVVGIGPEASIWFKWTANADSRVQVSTADSDFDTVLAIYSGDTFTNLVQIGSNDDAGGLQSLSTFTAAIDQTYYIAVAGKAGAEGTVELGITAVGSYALWLENWPSLTSGDRSLSADKDGDGFNNAVEMLCGLDPTLNSHPGGADPNAANAPLSLINSSLFDGQAGTSIRLTIDPNFVGLSHNGGAPVSFNGRLRGNDLAVGSLVTPLLLQDNTYEIPLTVLATPFRMIELVITDPNR